MVTSKEKTDERKSEMKKAFVLKKWRINEKVTKKVR